MQNTILGSVGYPEPAPRSSPSSAAAGGRFRQEALSDATDGLLRFARELAMSSLLTQRVPASKAMAWLAEVDRANG